MVVVIALAAAALAAYGAWRLWVYLWPGLEHLLVQVGLVAAATVAAVVVALAVALAADWWLHRTNRPTPMTALRLWVWRRRNPHRARYGHWQPARMLTSADEPPLRCAWCGNDIPDAQRKTKRFCSDHCRIKAHRAAKAVTLTTLKTGDIWTG